MKTFSSFAFVFFFLTPMAHAYLSPEKGIPANVEIVRVRAEKEVVKCTAQVPRDELRSLAAAPSGGYGSFMPMRTQSGSRYETMDGPLGRQEIKPWPTAKDPSGTRFDKKPNPKLETNGIPKIPPCRPDMGPGTVCVDQEKLKKIHQEKEDREAKHRSAEEKESKSAKKENYREALVTRYYGEDASGNVRIVATPASKCLPASVLYRKSKEVSVVLGDNVESTIAKMEGFRKSCRMEFGLAPEGKIVRVASQCPKTAAAVPAAQSAPEAPGENDSGETRDAN